MIFVIWHNSILFWTFKKSQFKHTDILWRAALNAKNGNGIAQGGGGGEGRKFQENFDSSIVIHQVFGAENGMPSS